MSGRPYDRATKDVEQRRRDLMRSDPLLYDYISARIAARELKRAGDTVSGARDGHGAANRLWAYSGDWADRVDRLRAAPDPENGATGSAGEERTPGLPRPPAWP